MTTITDGGHGTASATVERAQTPPSRVLVAGTVAAGALAAIAAAVGLLVPEFYRDAPTLVSQARGQDLLTLVVAVPALLVSLAFARRGSRRGYVLWLGVLGYLLYTYASYAFMTAFNELYLAYVAVLGLSLYTFVAGVVRLDAAAVKAALDGRRFRGVVAFEVFVVVLVAGVWLADIVPALLDGSVPASVADADIPVSAIHTLDLGILLPGFLVTAYWLWTRNPWGYAFTVILLAKVVTLGLAVLAMAAVMTVDGDPAPVPQVVIFGALTVASVALLARLLGAMAPDGTTDRPATDRSVDAR